MDDRRLSRRMLVYERKAKRRGFGLIVGIDEAGRGPLAGPVVACAVALRRCHFRNEIRDSKKLTPGQRERAFQEILEQAYVGVGIISESVIDRKNILQATYLAMANAVRDMVAGLPPEVRQRPKGDKRIYLLIDGNRFESELPYPFQTIVRGDDASLSIACASIMAKVIRDRILNVYDKIFPEYGFVRHKGYPTAAHKRAIRKFGLSPIHRKTFRCLS